MSTITIPTPVAPFATSEIGDDELYEVIDGQRVRTPPMGLFAVWIASELYRRLGNFAEAQDIGRAIVEALFTLPAPVNRDRRPDVAYVSFVRWAKDRPLPPTENAWYVVPNLATEVVSPTDIIDELEQKIDEYFRAGVELVWVVHPLLKKIHVYQSPTQITVLSRGDVLDGGTVVPGFNLPLMVLFPEQAQTAPANGAAKENA